MSDPRALTSASVWFRRANCPASEGAEHGCPPDPDTAQSERGVRLHYIDQWGESPDEQDVTRNEEWFIQKNKEIRDEFMANQLRARGIPEDANRVEISEERYYVRDFDGNVLIGIDGQPFSGQIDKIFWFPDHRILFVFDLKTGRKVVQHASLNSQLRVNLVSVCDEWGEFDAETAIAAITQPLCSPQITACAYSPNEIRMAKDEILRCWHACKSPDAPFNPSVDSCFFCRARCQCKAAAGLVAEMARTKISETPIEQLEQMAEKIIVMKAIIDGWENRIEFVATKYPHLLHRFELKQTGSLKTIKPENTVRAIDVLRDGGLVAPEDFVKACRVSVPQLGEIACDRAKVEQVLTNHGLLEVTEKKPTIAEKKQPKLKC
jgi:hypothetical protein